MYKFIVRGIIAFLLCVQSFVSYANGFPESVSRAEYILTKVSEGDTVCANISLIPMLGIENGKQQRDGRLAKRIVERPVVLCAFSEQTKTWQVIELQIEYPVKGEYIRCVQSAPTLDDRKNCSLSFRVVTPGYYVEQLRGYGVTRLIFDVYREKIIRIPRDGEIQEISVRGEKLQVYRTRHIWFDDNALASGDALRIIATAVAINYTPDHPDFIDAELSDIGAQFLYNQIQLVRRGIGHGLNSMNDARSRAFPERSLGDVVPWEIPMSLAIIEQIDDMAFRIDPKGEVESKLREYAMNQHSAFKWSQSFADAIGPLQFTRRTYNEMVSLYPRVQIEPQFDIGARNLENVLKAAIALIDYEISQFPKIHSIYKNNPKLGGAFPVAAYNGGPATARALYDWLKRNHTNIERTDIVLPSAFRMTRSTSRPTSRNKSRRVKHVVINSETPGYIVKYLYLLNYLADEEFE